MTALRAERYSQAVGLSTRSSAPEAMLRTITSCVRSAASSRSPTRAAMNDWSRWRVAAQEEPGSGRSSVLERWALLMGAPSRDLDGTDELAAVWTQRGGRSSVGRVSGSCVPCAARSSPPAHRPLHVGPDPGEPMTTTTKPTGRIQLALNVADLAAAVRVYSDMFGTGPSKERPGYANFAIADPPLKLVLFEDPGATSPLNHLGVEL